MLKWKNNRSKEGDCPLSYYLLETHDSGSLKRMLVIIDYHLIFLFHLALSMDYVALSPRVPSGPCAPWVDVVALRCPP